MSGYLQYPGAIAIWLKLIDDPSVQVMAIYPKNIDVSNSKYVVRPLKSKNEAWTTKNEYLRLMATAK